MPVAANPESTTAVTITRMTQVFIRAVLIATVAAVAVILLLEAMSVAGALKVGGLVGFLVGLLYLVPRAAQRPCPRCGVNLQGVGGAACPNCGLALDDPFDTPASSDQPGMTRCVICGTDFPEDAADRGCPVCEAALRRVETPATCPNCNAEQADRDSAKCVECGAALTLPPNADSR